MGTYVGRTTDEEIASAYEIGLSDAVWRLHRGISACRLFGWWALFAEEAFEEKTGIVLRRGEVCKA